MRSTLEQIDHPLNFFVNVLFMGNDFLYKIQSKITDFNLIENDTFSPQLLAKNHSITFDSVSCENYLNIMNWVITYYRKPFRHDKVPFHNNFNGLSEKKITFDELQKTYTQVNKLFFR